MTTTSLETVTAGLDVAGRDEPTAEPTLDAMFDHVELAARAAEFYKTRSESLIPHFVGLAEVMKTRRPDWLNADDDDARLIRRIEAFADARESAATSETITVHQLAEGIGRTPGATRKLLDSGLIPGAQRITPGLANSPWIIPVSAIENFKRRAA
jgi:hypothetical protein